MGWDRGLDGCLGTTFDLHVPLEERCSCCGCFFKPGKWAIWNFAHEADWGGWELNFIFLPFVILNDIDTNWGCMDGWMYRKEKRDLGNEGDFMDEDETDDGCVLLLLLLLVHRPCGG